MITYLVAKTNLYSYWFGYMYSVVKSNISNEEKVRKFEWAFSQLDENLDILKERHNK